MLKFPAGDRIVLNGAVIENVGRGARLRVLTPNTQLLRLRDAINPEEAVTPVGRLCHATQLMLVGECDVDAVLAETFAALVPLHEAFMDEEDKLCVQEIRTQLSDRDFYRALRTLGRLRKREAILLSRVPQ
ncbi:flagellar biosynthesis repressor FlbT [Jannaschia pagri]|uniref:Flagellar biosynthesis repressor FlbT n=1 Tax=Jannaschia pagri TaxID=2829797 RepID=A0ABQ4NM15_9RHOB|nr:MULTISPECIES: flagellar biosynthesis repressor FlbT [unclassified Jannaschia]GIT91617.1 flagellar biosynthesis repressor FlbT [Jannaschia sp. AI_61]GIT95451.1 flagellar biosynthesis repressor FlbT [Jannaschia sp. AI_62]